MLTLEEAQNKILDVMERLPVERIRLGDAFGRIAAEAVASPVDLPPADNSSVDGYAVRSADLAKATAEAPVSLRLLGTAPAGRIFAGAVEPGGCARIFTGSVVPRGADAIVMQEDVKVVADGPARILFIDKVPPLENVRTQGGDVRKGVSLVEAGERLTVGKLSLLAATGLDHINAGRKPVTGIVATGSELREAGGALEPGTIFESNRLGLSIMAGQAGAVPKVFPLVPDDLAATRRILEQAFEECDVVVTSGGVSVGEADWVRTALTDIGGQVDFWSVAMKPGRPFAFGLHRKKPLFGLPGNPVSALVTFFLLVRPALLRMQGARDVRPPSHMATLAEPLANRGGRRHFMRVIVDVDGKVVSAGTQASHILTAAARSNGLIDVPPDTTLPAGSMARVLRWD